LALPKSCKMPDLAHLDSLIPCLMTALLSSEGRHLTKNEKLYVRVFVRLVDKAITAYEATRACVIATVEEMQRSPEEMEQQGRQFYMFGFINNMENCLNAARRLFSLLDSVKSEAGGLQIKRDLSRRIATHFNAIKDIRVAVEHIESKIQGGEISGPVMLTVSDDDESVEIAGYSIRFEDIARLLKHFHAMALQWLDDFCKKSALKEFAMDIREVSKKKRAVESLLE